MNDDMKKSKHLTESEKEYMDIILFYNKYTPKLIKKLGRYNE